MHKLNTQPKSIKYSTSILKASTPLIITKTKAKTTPHKRKKKITTQDSETEQKSEKKESWGGKKEPF